MKIKDILSGRRRAPDFAVVYIIRDGDEILYVGQSIRVEDRISQHFGYVGSMYGTPFSEWAVDSLPRGFDWDVEFIELPEDAAAPRYWMRMKEAELIRKLQPKYNIEGKYRPAPSRPAEQPK